MKRLASAHPIVAAVACALLALQPSAGSAGAPAAAVRSVPDRPASTTRSWLIEDFRAEVHVKRSGDIDVTETLQVRFEGSYNGIFRTIPVQYVTPRGLTCGSGSPVWRTDRAASWTTRRAASAIIERSRYGCRVRPMPSGRS